MFLGTPRAPATAQVLSSLALSVGWTGFEQCPTRFCRCPLGQLGGLHPDGLETSPCHRREVDPGVEDGEVMPAFGQTAFGQNQVIFVTTFAKPYLARISVSKS